MAQTELEFVPNSLYYGDCLDVLARWPPACVDLVYLDPPFNSKTNYNVLYGSRDGASAQLRAFSDTWHWDAAAAQRMEEIERAPGRRSHKVLRGLSTILGDSGMLAYLSYMAQRLEGCRRVMTDRASLYLHCDPSASHYLKLVCDGVFGADRFRNEIVWKRTGAHAFGDGYAKVHDIVLFYAGAGYVWNPLWLPHDPTYVKRAYARSHPTLGPWRSAPLIATGRRGGESGRPWRGIDPDARGNFWRTPTKGVMCEFIRKHNLIPGWPETYPGVHERLDALDAAKLIHWPEKTGGVPSLILPLAATKGNAVSDVIIDVKRLERSSEERLGYPTQKPTTLLKRFIEASTNAGDIVLDPFCGCGSTIAAAEETRRRWVGIDISPFAVKLVRDRRLRRAGRDAIIRGIPTDLEGARTLLERNPCDFEAWAVTSIPGMVPNEREARERGIDGRAAMMHPPTGEDSRLVLAQMKGAKYAASTMREFKHVLSREQAAAGVYITLDQQTARDARSAASALGTIEVGARRYPKLQMWSIEELLKGQLPDLPDMADPYTGERIRQTELFE